MSDLQQSQGFFNNPINVSCHPQTIINTARTSTRCEQCKYIPVKMQETNSCHAGSQQCLYQGTKPSTLPGYDTIPLLHMNPTYWYTSGEDQKARTRMHIY